MITLDAVKIAYLDQAQVPLTSKNTLITVKMIRVLVNQILIRTVLHYFKHQTQIKFVKLL